jgi:CRISPR-associated protein Cas2
MYLIAYDISNPKRRAKIRKIAYSYALGGQKSAVEAEINKKEVLEIARKLSAKMNLEVDRAHIVKVEKFIYLRSAKEITYKNGDIII